MFKNVLIIFGILISIFLMLTISLHNGIKIDNISFKNINIQGLYLKYDKKLIIDTRNISIGYHGDTKTIDMKIKFSIENFFGDCFIDVYEYVLFDPYLKVSGKFVLNLNDLSLESIAKNIIINDFALQFNDNLKFITAESCFINLKDNDFYFSFKKPMYEGVSLKGSKASILDLDRLKLELTSQDKLKKPLLELLSNYKVKLPVTQEYGQDTISTDLMIPFDIKKELQIHSKIRLKNSKIYLYKIPLYVQKMTILLDNNILKGSGVLRKIDDKNSSFEYNSNIRFKINFRNNFVDGNFTTQNLLYKAIHLNTIKGNFNLDFKNDLFANIFIKRGKLKLASQEYLLDNSIIKYKNLDNKFYSQLNLSNQNLPYAIKIYDTFNLSDNNSSGNVAFHYNDKNIDLSTDTIRYNADYSKDTIIDIALSKLKGKIFDYRCIGSNIDLQYSQEALTGVAGDINCSDDFVHLDSQNFLINYNKHSNKLLSVDMNNSVLSLNDINIGLKSNQIQYYKNKIDINSSFQNQFKSGMDSIINGSIDLKSKHISGDIKLINSKKEQKETFPYTLNYENSEILLDIPKIDFRLKKDYDGVITTSANNLLFLKEYCNFIKPYKDSKFLLSKDKNGNININLDHISMNLDAYDNNFFKKDREKKLQNKKLNLYWKNSFVQFNKFHLFFDQLNLRSKDRNLYLDLKKDATHITINKIDKNIIIKSKKIDASYIDLIFGKDVLKGGYIDLFATGGYGKYQGDIKLYNTTLIQMKLVDNLLLFINSTPILVNPLLAIPTIFRFTQNNFELGGYYVKNGLIKFNYNVLNKYLNIYKINTNGAINDFEGEMRLHFLDNSIKGKLNVSTLKDYAKIIDNIPLVNYLLLDKNGKFSIPISLYGTIENPSYKIVDSVPNHGK